ncbi:MAG: CRISPR-associated protein Cas4 [Candidatus Bathyarchaeota archaeon]|nr:CRISPR-associated protein Cas4 [Candidatus Termitimicrobium sp.]MCL2431010.1 CRISPR-associated protein Cas4 [Candidatus Termitimicrobium sp.]
MEHAFCPRFTYFQLVLGIEQREDKRGTVQSGRAFHSRYSTTNKNYKINHLDGIKQTERLLYSRKYSFSGKIDEAIETDKEILIIERKYSDYILIGPTIKTQLGLLAILAEENTGKKVNKAIVVFNKTERVEVPVYINEKIKQIALRMLQKTNHTIISGDMPYSKRDNRCPNCCYRKICP